LRREKNSIRYFENFGKLIVIKFENFGKNGKKKFEEIKQILSLQENCIDYE